MAINVNPPPQIKVPKQFAGDREVSAWIINNQRTLTQLWLRSGGATDSNESLQAQIDELFVLIGGLGDLVETTTSTNYTTVSNNLVRVTGSCSITLNLSPEVGEVSLIQPQGNYLVTVIGHINGGSSVTMSNAFDLMEVKYTAGGWVIV
jgi:hypothetical protein